MAETLFERMLRLAMERKGWNRPRLTIELGKTKADLTNWKNRKVPDKDHRLIAGKLGMTVDEFLGERTARQKAASGEVVLLHVTQADVDLLDADTRAMTMELIATVRGAIRRRDGGSRMNRGPKT